MRSKRCTVCKKTKPLKAFNRSRLMLDGRRSFCRDCNSILCANRRLEKRHRYWANATLANHRKWGHKVLITVDWLTKLALKTFACPWCGTALLWGEPNGQRRVNSPSLDRLYNTKVMNKRNVLIVCYRCNAAKGADTLANYLAWLYKPRSKTTRLG